MPQKMELYDATLREGPQSREVNLSVTDKLEIVKALDDFGVDYIELGWPGSNPKDMETFLEAAKLKLKNAKIAAFGSTKRKGIKAEDDANLQAILKSKAKVATIFGKTIKEHIEKQLNATLDENLSIIKESVAFLKSKGLTVFYDAEHFFDGYKDDKEYALKCLNAALAGKADCLVLCDTNGGCLPSEILSTVKEIREKLGKKVNLGIHLHNDSGCAVANTLIVSPYLRQVQVTVNGFGERTGNADLCQVVPNLILKKNVKFSKVRIEKLKALSDLVYVLANIKQNKAQPYVGKNAFSHKGGVHVDAVMKGASYEHINPDLVGNKRDIVLSELSGKANIVEVAKSFGIKASKDDPRAKAMLEEVEKMEKKGYNIGDVRAEKALLVNKYFGSKKGTYEIDTWKIMSERRGEEFSECVLTGKVDGKQIEVVAPLRGGGPVGATYRAIQKLLATDKNIKKDVNKVELTNYKVMMAEDKGPESSVRVYIEFQANGNLWGNVGVSTNILEASLEAIKKGFQYYLSEIK